MDRRQRTANSVGRAGLALACFALAAALPAQADDDEVLQIKQAFEPTVLTVAQGAIVKFVNADDVNHNLQLVSPDGSKEDKGLDKPGETTEIAFAKAGQYSVICAIHPRMKIRVTVK